MLNSTRVKAVTCVLKTTMTKMNKICRPNVLKVRWDHNMFFMFSLFLNINFIGLNRYFV